MKLFLFALLACLFALVPFLPGETPAGAVSPQDDWMEPGERQPVQPLSFDGKEFSSAFNASADQARLVIVFSPT